MCMAWFSAWMGLNLYIETHGASWLRRHTCNTSTNTEYENISVVAIWHGALIFICGSEILASNWKITATMYECSKAIHQASTLALLHMFHRLCALCSTLKEAAIFTYVSFALSSFLHTLSTLQHFAAQSACQEPAASSVRATMIISRR